MFLYQRPFLFTCLVKNIISNIPCKIVRPLNIGELKETKKAVNTISSMNITIIIASKICCDLGMLFSGFVINISFIEQ